MNRKLKQWISGILLTCMLAVLAPYQVFTSFAADARIAFSDPTTTVGSEVSVTMKVSSLGEDALGNTDIMLAYDADKLEFINETENASGGAGSIRVWTSPENKKEMATVLKFKALAPGTAKISVSTWEIYDNNGQMANVDKDKEGSSSITINALATSSKDANLQSLKVSPGTLQPSFSPETDNYAVSVGLDIADLTIDAPANNSKAKVEIEGNTNLQPGENTVVCKVTAEDGVTTKTYTIKVNKIEGGDSQPAVSGTQEGTEPGGNQGTAEPEILVQLSVSTKRFYLLNPGDDIQMPDGFVRTDISVGEDKVKVPGWVPSGVEGTPPYCIFYAMNDAGETDFYRYDRTEKTIQKYFADPDAAKGYTEEEYKSLAEDHNSLIKDFKTRGFIIIGLIVVCVILVIGLIILAITKKGGNGPRGGRGRYDRMDDFDDREPALRGRSAPGEEEDYLSDTYEGYDEEEEYARMQSGHHSQPQFNPGYEDYQTNGNGFGIDDEPLNAGMNLNRGQSEADDDFEFFDLDD